METRLPQFLYDLWSVLDLRTWRLYYCTDMQPCTKENHLCGQRDNPFSLLHELTKDDWMGLIKCFWTAALLVTLCLSFMTDCYINSFNCLLKVYLWLSPIYRLTIWTSNCFPISFPYLNTMTGTTSENTYFGLLLLVLFAACVKCWTQEIIGEIFFYI